MAATEDMVDTAAMEAMVDTVDMEAMAVTITLPRATRAAMATDWEPRPTAPTTGTGQATPSTTSLRRRSLSTTAAIIICTSVAMVIMAITDMVAMAATDMAGMDMVAM